LYPVSSPVRRFPNLALFADSITNLVSGEGNIVNNNSRQSRKQLPGIALACETGSGRLSDRRMRRLSALGGKLARRRTDGHRL